MGIKVNTQSWHCRLLDFKDEKFGNHVGYDRPQTLCVYFWAVVFAPIKLALAVTIMGIMMLFGFAENEHGNIEWLNKPAFWTTFVAATVMFYLAIPMMTLVWSINYLTLMLVVTTVIEMGCLIGVALILKETYDDREKKPSEGESFLFLAWQTLKAAKRNVCPLIEYKEA